MPVPATLTSYLPVLLVSVTHSTAPDDTSFSTLPAGQVDYLSHEWREEDVWSSWRSMTRQKNAIANGMRLENASWRTWWKQRNKLKTISPETLNWLKDSDVTWLYGPLHIGSDWSPPPRGTDSLLKSQRQNSTDAIPSRNTAATSRLPTKPILKRRSITQLLSLPSSHWYDQYGSDEEHDDNDGRGGEDAKSQRPPLLHTKSDTHISWRGRAHRKDSPPRIIAEEMPGPSIEPPAVAVGALTSSDASHATSEHELSASTSASGESSASGASSDSGLKKKHISFNTFVEQCIAIEKPKSKRPPVGRRGSPVFSYDDGYEEDSEATYEDESYDSPSGFYAGSRSDNSDSDDDDDDVIEMRSSRSRASSVSSMHGAPKPVSTGNASSHSPHSHPHYRPPLMRKASTGGDRVTIAPIAPTILKSTGVGNNLRFIGAGRETSTSKEVDLVYAPPTHSNYSRPGTPDVRSPAAEDVYHHRESYFTIGTSPSPQGRSPQTSPQIPTVAALPPPSLSSSPPKYEHARTFYPRPSDLEDATMEDTFDFFDGPTEDVSSAWPAGDSHTRRTRGRDNLQDDFDGRPSGVVRYAEGGASSVQTGRSREDIPMSYSPGQSPPDAPMVVVNEVSGATEERTERSREGSPSFADPDSPTSPPTYVHTLPPAVPVPRIGTTHPYISFSPQLADTVHLSPSDITCRGRSLVGAASGSSVSGSTTSGSTNYTRSTDSRSDSRGRSVTRNGSYSDRERSGSRSSRGTNSPMGSLSPTGSALGLGAAHVRGRDRDRESRGMRMGSDEERGRERTGRPLTASVSPPNPLGSPRAQAAEVESPSRSSSLVDVQPDRSDVPSPPSSVSGSSTSTASIATLRQPLYENQITVPRTRVSLNTADLPSPIPEEDEQRSRHPTPANSPVTAFNPIVPSSGDAASSSVPEGRLPSPPVSLERAAKTGSTSPVPIPRFRDRVPRSAAEDQPGFVGRAVDIVSSARGFLGSIWNSSTS